MIKFRSAIRQSDVSLIRDIVISTGFFSQEEVDIAIELLKEAIKKGCDSDYLFQFAEENGVTKGYVCYGPIAGSHYSFDIYWIAVHNEYQGQGIGRKLLSSVEKDIMKKGGKRIYIETSSRELYKPTRSFYESAKYKVAAMLDDFYDLDDDKVIFLKILKN